MHRHTGPWPDINRNAWLQWTASPPSIADLDRDGRNEVIGLPNVERHEPYETQSYAFAVLDSAQGGGARSARRHRGFERMPLTGKPAARGDDLYPPSGIPAPTIVNIRGDRRPEIVAAVPDGRVWAVGPGGRKLWSYDYTRGAPETFASEVVGRRPQPRRAPRARLRDLRPVARRGATRRALRDGAQAARGPPPASDRQRQWRRDRGGAVDRRHRRRRAAGDRRDDDRPRHRRATACRAPTRGTCPGPLGAAA